MSLYQYRCAVAGFNQANGGGEQAPPPGDDEADMMMATAERLYG